MPDDIPEGGEVAPFLDGTAPVQVTTAPGELGAADLRAAAPSEGGDEALLDDMAPLAPAAAPTFAPGEGPDAGAAEQALRRLPQVDSGAGDPPTSPPPRAPDDEDRPPE
jgi:hypothetical protein